MRKAIILFLISICFLDIYGQQDTVFIRQNENVATDSLIYVTDTIVFPSSMTRNFLMGTTVLPNTQNQLQAYGFGLYFDSVSKSGCQKSGRAAYMAIDKINYIVKTDSTLKIDINIYDNCCYDFICDISVDSLGVLNLIYYGYGTNCACNCCFGLKYNFSIMTYSSYPEIIGVMLNRNKKTYKKIK